MQRMAKYLVVAFISLQISGFVRAQPGIADAPADSTQINLLTRLGIENVFTVRDIIISGNKKTKESVILRELPFKKGDKKCVVRTGEKV